MEKKQRSGRNLHLIQQKKTQKSALPDSGFGKLLKGCANGDAKSQKALYDALSPKMFSICIRYMGSRDVAEDVLQDGFVTLFNKLDSYSGEGSFEGWARKIFVNTALMSLRKNDVLRQSEELDSAQNIISGSTTQLQDIGYKELMDMITSMPTGYRTVFNMYVIEGYSHKEIAQALGISEATSRSQLLRARALLQEKIKERKDAD